MTMLSPKTEFKQGLQDSIFIQNRASGVIISYNIELIKQAPPLLTDIY